MCPNCRQDADLEAPVDVETETWEAILRTTDPRTPIVEAGTNRDPQVNLLNFQPFPDLTTQFVAQRETHLPNDMHSLTLNRSNEADRNLSTSPERELSVTRSLTPSLSPIIEIDAPPSRISRDLTPPAAAPIGISRRVRALS